MLIFIGLFLLCTEGAGMAGEPDKELLIRGKVVCVDEIRAEVPCANSNHLFALKAADDKTFVFIPEDSNSKIFKDERLHGKELLVKAWNRGEDRLEIIKVYSLRDGQVFDIHYFCSTCNIKAFVGGLCWCCQDEFEFRETPVRLK